MFSSTASPSKTFGTWVLIPTPSAATSNGSRSVTWMSRMTTLPAVARSCPVRHLKKVDLPAPLGPMRQRSSFS